MELQEQAKGLDGRGLDFSGVTQEYIVVVTEEYIGGVTQEYQGKYVLLSMGYRFKNVHNN